jgi:hypothetical protein
MLTRYGEGAALSLGMFRDRRAFTLGHRQRAEAATSQAAAGNPPY